MFVVRILSRVVSRRVLNVLVLWIRDLFKLVYIRFSWYNRGFFMEIL